MDIDKCKCYWNEPCNGDCTKDEKKFDPTKPVKTRGGKEVRIICVDRESDVAEKKRKPIIALVRFDNRGERNEEIYTYALDGTAPYLDESMHLVNVEPEEWINIHKNFWGDYRNSSQVFSSEKEAKGHADKFYLSDTGSALPYVYVKSVRIK